MGYPIYYVEAGDTLPILFDTFDGGTGASITMSGLAVTDIEIYKDGSVTQRASDAGYTLLDTDGIDFDGTTGIHGFSIDLSDNTDAGFYAVGSWYHVVVSSITVDSQTVNFVAAAFRIVSATRGMAGTALPDAAAGAAGGLPTDSAGKTSFNDIAATAVVSSGAITTSGGAVSNVTTVGSVTGAVGSVTGAVGSVAGNVDGNVTGSVGSLGATAKTDVNAEVDTALVDIKLDHLIAVADADDPVDNSIIAKMVSKSATADWSSFVNTTDALEAIRDRGDAAWTTGAGGSNPFLVASGTIGATGNDTTHLHLDGLAYVDDAINDLLIIVTDVSASLTYSTWITDWANTGDLATVDTLPFTPEASVDTYSVVGVRRNNYKISGTKTTLDALNDVAATDIVSSGAITTSGGAVSNVTTVATTTTNTDMRGTDNAALASVCTEARLAELDAANLPTDVAAVKTDTAATLVDTNELQTDWTNGGRLDLLIDAIKAVTDVIPDSGALTTIDGKIDTVDTVVDAIKVVTDALTSAAAAKMATAANTTITGTAQTGTLSTTQATTNLPNTAQNDIYNGRIITWHGNVTAELAGQQTDITDYASAGGLITFTAITTAPANGDTFTVH